MLIANASTLARVRGTSLIEVLITLIVLAVGLLGLGVLQVKMQQAQVDSYQRAQAILLLNDMTERIAAHYDAAPAYVTGTTNALGVGDGLPTDCSGTAAGPSRDRCDWSSALKGSAETLTVGGAARNAGAMIDAHGCVVVKQVPNSAAGICAPGIYQVIVAWQGQLSTAVPALTCGMPSGAPLAATVRAMSLDVTIGLPKCS